MADNRDTVQDRGEKSTTTEEVPDSVMEFSNDAIFRLLVSDSPLPVSIQDETWKFVYVNAAYSDFVGYSAEELIGSDPSVLLFPPEDDASLMGNRRIVEKNQYLTLPHYPTVRELIKRNGSRATCRVHLSGAHTSDGRHLWCGILFDLSNFESTVARLAEAEARSQEMRFRFDSFAALSNEAMIVADVSKDRPLHANSVAWDVLGLSAPDLTEAPVATLWANIDEPDKSAFANALARGSSQRGNEVNVLLSHPSTGRRSIRIRTFRSVLPTAETYILAEDMTEHIRIEEQRLHEALLRRDALIKEVHHRIKNNLQGVIGVLQAARTEGASAESAINEAIHKINAIAEVNGMLTSGNTQIAVNELVSRLADYLGNAFDAEVSTTYNLIDSDIEPPVVNDDAVPIALVMNEIITNAIKHNQKDGGITIEINHSVEEFTIVVTNYGKIQDEAYFESVRPGTHGLGLVKALLPDPGNQFSLCQDGRTVSARLKLDPSLIRPAG